MHLVFARPEPAETGGGGGSDYIDGLAPALRELGHRVDILAGPDPVFAAGAVPIIDGMLLPRLRPRLDECVARDAVALIHHVAAAAGRDDGAREAVLATEREMLPRLRRVVTTSQIVAERVATEFGVTAHPVPPGVRDLQRATPDRDTPLVLAIGVFTRRKRHDALLHAMARLQDLAWHLVIAGDANREPDHAAELTRLVDQLGLADRVTLLHDPADNTLDHAWSETALYASASRWEGYPTSAAEALRRGVPVVITDASNPAAIIPADAGAICAIDDLATFGKCLRRLLYDRDLRTDMADAAWRAGRALPSWTARAAEFIAVLET